MIKCNFFNATKVHIIKNDYLCNAIKVAFQLKSIY